MNYAVRYYRYRPGQIISVYDEHVRRWCEATVVTASLTLVTAFSKNVRFYDLPASPQYVRPVLRAQARRAA